MYNKPVFTKTSISINNTIQAEPIERQIERSIKNKDGEKLNGAAPLMYTERRQGVIASTNVRTDRWEIAVEGTDKIAKSYEARREEKPLKVVKSDSEAKPIEGTQQAV